MNIGQLLIIALLRNNKAGNCIGTIKDIRVCFLIIIHHEHPTTITMMLHSPGGYNYSKAHIPPEIAFAVVADAK